MKIFKNRIEKKRNKERIFIYKVICLIKASSMNIYGCIFKTQKCVGLLYLHKSWRQKNRGVKGYSNGTKLMIERVKKWNAEHLYLYIPLILVLYRTDWILKRWIWYCRHEKLLFENESWDRWEGGGGGSNNLLTNGEYTIIS